MISETSFHIKAPDVVGFKLSQVISRCEVKSASCSVSYKIKVQANYVAWCYIQTESEATTKQLETTVSPTGNEVTNITGVTDRERHSFNTKSSLFSSSLHA